MRRQNCFALPFILIAFVAISCGSQEQKNEAYLRVATESYPDSIDPREARSLTGATVVNALFEGLMRFTANGQLAAGIAHSVDVSDDLLTYTFHLRNTQWSNGKPVTAEDFIYSWKSQLDPNFPAPNAFLLYPIKFAHAAKASTVSLDEIGVSAPDPHTLTVTLEQPTPYFLQLTAFYALFPVYPGDSNVTNGPFEIDSSYLNKGLVLLKNPYYWDANAVHLEGVTFLNLEERIALDMLETGELDWAGSPLSAIPAEAYASLNAEHKLSAVPVAATHWFRFNTNKAPFNHPKIRHALALAINRQELVDHLIPGKQRPAMGIVPSYGKEDAVQYFKDDDQVTARRLLAEALTELRITKDELPPITFIYGNTDRHHKIAQAVQQQWKRTLGLDIAINSSDAKLYFDRLQSGDYQIANGSWFADYNDPINFLEVFSDDVNGTNNTGWENARFQQLLQQSETQPDPQKRTALLKEAEALLMADMPVAPLFFYCLSYVKSPRVEGVGITPTGILIFRDGTLTKTP